MNRVGSRVLVLGAGVIGAAVADALARHGISVTVLESRSPGAGASQASAGILAPYVEADDASPLLALGVRSLGLWDDFAGRLLETVGRSFGYSRSGTLQVALDERAVASLALERDRLQARGIAARWIVPDDLRAFEPAVTPTALGALLIHSHGSVNVRAFVGALIESARRAGAIVEPSVEVTRIESQDHGVRVHAGTRTIDADAVVVATGSWSGRMQIDGVAPLPMRPVRGQLLQLRWTGELPGRVIWGPRGYAVPMNDGSVLFGATAEDAGFDETSTPDAERILTAAAQELLPDAVHARLDGVRVGLRPALPDNLPAIGPFPGAPRVVVATGHYRNGILLAPLTADIVTKYLVDGETDPAIAITTPSRLALA